MIAKLKFHLKLLFSYISLFNMIKYVKSNDSSQEDMFSLESILDTKTRIPQNRKKQ